MELLDAGKIESLLKNPKYRIKYKESVDSTNEWAKREAAEGGADGTVYLADTQTAGKGSRGRSWESPEGTSVAMSILLRPEIPVQRVSMLTLVMGMAAADGIRKASGLQTGIKWPNDVVYDGKKLCGILTEMGGNMHYVVPGIGINVNQTSFPGELADKAASILMETGKRCSRERVTAEILNCFADYYAVFLQTNDLSGLIDRYEAMLVNRNEKVHVIDKRDPFDGVALGIDPMGDLLIRRSDNGQTVKVFSGEVSVRGIYGYV